QGVLLLNAVLTVEEGRAGAHAGKGWEGFTDHIVETLAREREGLVFMLWGSYAQKKGARIDPRRHRVLKAPHPSPLSAHRGCTGCGPCAAANEYLVRHGQAAIDWALPASAELAAAASNASRGPDVWITPPVRQWPPMARPVFHEQNAGSPSRL